MGTVLIDRYRLVCPRCGLDTEFMTGAGQGSYDAVEKARRIHAAEAQRRECGGDDLITVTILAKTEESARPDPQQEHP